MTYSSSQKKVEVPHCGAVRSRAVWRGAVAVGVYSSHVLIEIRTCAEAGVRYCCCRSRYCCRAVVRDTAVVREDTMTLRTALKELNSGKYASLR